MTTCSQPSARNPIGQGEQIGGHGAVGAHLLMDGSVWVGRQQARHDEPLVNVQAAAAFVQHAHDFSLLSPEHR
jgi:hypothetical protein